MSDPDVTTAKKMGRPAEYDRELVRDMTMQVLIEFYNERQNILREQIRKDPDFVSKLREKARFMDVTTTAWLHAIDATPRGVKGDKRELMFRKWACCLEPPMGKAVLDANPEREKELRTIYMKHCTDMHWRTNCKRWIDGIQRVRTDNCITLNVPLAADMTEAEDDDFFI